MIRYKSEKGYRKTDSLTAVGFSVDERCEADWQAAAGILCGQGLTQDVERGQVWVVGRGRGRLVAVSLGLAVAELDGIDTRGQPGDEALGGGVAND